VTEAGAAPLFEALIVPHRSLTRRGVFWVVASVGAVSLAVGARFWMLGAWPVLPFGVAETGFVWLMFSLNARHARASECLILTEGTLRIVSTDASGRRREMSLPSGWLSVSLQERDGRVPRMALRGGGVDVEVANALGEAAKRDLAASLAAALHRARNPVFDNPQLRG